MKKILLVEDDNDIAELERDYLEASGFTVDISADGDEGKRRALTGEYSLLLLDVMLPGADGFAICRDVRKALDIPILMVSARLEDSVQTTTSSSRSAQVSSLRASKRISRATSASRAAHRPRPPSCGSARSRFSRGRTASSSRDVRYISPRESSICSSSSPSIRRSYSARRRSMTASGISTRWATPPPSPST